MKIDFTIKPLFESGGRWNTASIYINTQKAVDAYNEYFCTEKRKGDKFIISANAYKELKQLIEMKNLTSIFG